MDTTNTNGATISGLSPDDDPIGAMLEKTTNEAFEFVLAELKRRENSPVTLGRGRTVRMRAASRADAVALAAALSHDGVLAVLDVLGRATALEPGEKRLARLLLGEEDEDL